MRTMVSRAVAWRWMAACLLGLPLLAACGSEGEDARPPTGASQVGAIAQAQGLMQTGDFAGAEALLVEFTAQEPDSAQAWAMLGLAVHSQQRWEEALALHLKAAEFPVTEGTGLFRAGLAHVQLGEVDQAFDAWQRAKATGTFDITQIGLSPGSAPVREDPRYADLFPTPEQFSEPFVEPVRIIHEWVGENPGDQFGWIARDIGDVDGDGVHDLVTSAPTWGPEGSSRGRVYAYSGRTGALLWVADGEPGDQLGIGVEAAGDVNSDGVPDVIAGGPGGERAVVWSGMDGAVLLELAGQESGEGFGGSVTDVGDLNGDGHDEVLVGAAGNGEAGPGAGAAYLFSGTDGSLLFKWLGETAGSGFGSAIGGGVGPAGQGQIVVGAPGAGDPGIGRVYAYRISRGPAASYGDEPAFVIESDPTGGALGAMFVSVVGDVDGDGTPDVYGSDWAHGGLGPQTGQVYVHSGATGERLLTLSGEAAGDGFGIGPADAGDVDGDGHDDLVIGAWQQGNAAPSGGKIYLYSGADGALLGSATGKVMGETLGFDATGIGDVDGDGVPDLLVTSAWSAILGTRSGRMFILSGRMEGES